MHIYPPTVQPTYNSLMVSYIIIVGIQLLLCLQYRSKTLLCKQHQEDTAEESEEQCTAVNKHVWCRNVLFLAYLLLYSGKNLSKYILFISSSFLLL